MGRENGFLKSFSFKWCFENSVTSSLEVSKSLCVSSRMIALLLFFISMNMFYAETVVFSPLKLLHFIYIQVQIHY